MRIDLHFLAQLLLPLLVDAIADAESGDSEESGDHRRDQNGAAEGSTPVFAESRSFFLRFRFRALHGPQPDFFGGLGAEADFIVGVSDLSVSHQNPLPAWF